MTSSRTNQPSHIMPVILALAGLSAFLFIVLVTPYGPGLRDDSYTYLSAAEFLTTNGQYARPSALGKPTPISNFPPAYSLLLTIPIFLKADLILSVKLINAVLFATLIVTSGYLVYEVSKRIVLTIVAVCLLMTSSELIHQFTWAQSETLFLSLIPLGILFPFYFLKSAGNIRKLIASTIVLSILFLTRYSGFSLIFASVLVILLSPYTQLRRRIHHAFFLAGSSSILTVLFLLRNFILIGNLTNRPMPFWHPPDKDTLLLGFREILMWFIPDRLVLNLNFNSAAMILIGFTAALGFLSLILLKGDSLQDPEQGNTKLILKILFIHLVVYALFIIVTIFFLDVLTPMNDRILSPLRLFLSFEIIFLGHVISRYRPPIGLRLSQALLGVLLIFQAYRSVHLVRSLRMDGQGYSESTWRSSETLIHVCQLPPVPLYSNDLPAIYFYCDRIVTPIPAPMNLASQTPNSQYQAEFQRMREDLMNNQGYLIILGWYGEPRLERLGLSSFIEELNVDMMYKDGLILSY